MNTTPTVFSQIMNHLPLHDFRKCVRKYHRDHKIESFSCLDQFLSMAFAQLTYRESLRDIEVCLRSQKNKLYYMGIRSQVSRNTLANANTQRDWCLYADFAQVLIHIARGLYLDDDFGVELNDTVYPLDSTTIDLCLTVFPWARFRKTKAAIKLHTLLDLRGAIPTFICITDGKVSDVNILDPILPEAGSFYVMDRDYLDFLRLHQILRQHHKTAPDIFDQQFLFAHPNNSTTLQMPLAGRTFFQMDQTTSAHQKVLRNFRERSEDTSLDCRVRLCACRHHKKTPETHPKPLHNSTNFECQRF